MLSIRGSASIIFLEQRCTADVLSGPLGVLLCPPPRDFFLYTALKEGAMLERPEGLRDEGAQAVAVVSREEPEEPDHDAERFRRWCAGRTGFPFVDACMRELAATGYMSNRGRQNMSSFLTKARATFPIGQALACRRFP